MGYLLPFLGVLLAVVRAVYQPELMMTITANTLNKEISTNFGKNISQAINNYHIDDQHFEQKVEGVKVKFDLTNIHQNATINWNGNLLHVIDMHTFKISSKGINFTLNGHLDVKIGITRRQKGPLKVIIEKISTNTTLSFLEHECPKSVGFDLQVSNIDVHTGSISIKIQGKAFDNWIIKEVEKFLLPRVPELINKAVKTQVNPMITKATCTRPEETVYIGDQFYIAVANTTKIPQFDQKLTYLKVPLDLTLQNELTNKTHQQLQKDDLPYNQLFQGESDASLALSSNFLNMATWLINDAHLLHLKVTNQMLGPDPLIALNTTNLSILLPGLKKWPGKEVFLLITPSLQYEHLFLRSGRMVSSLSLSVQFVVNQSDWINDTEECIELGECIVAVDLNLTLSASLVLKIRQKLVRGLVHTLSIYQVDTISTQIFVNTQGLKSILNSIVGSLIPNINNMLGDEGIPLPTNITQLLAKYDISDIREQTFRDFVAVGLTMDL